MSKLDQIELETELNRMDFNMMIWSGLKFVSGKNIVVCDGSRTVGEKAADRMVLGGVRVGGHERKAKKQLDWECMQMQFSSDVSFLVWPVSLGIITRQRKTEPN